MNFKPGCPGSSPSLPVCFFLLVLVFLPGCIATSSNTVEKPCLEFTASENGGRVSVFLHAAYSGGVHREIDLKAVEVLSGDEWLPIMVEPRKLNTGLFDKGQAFLGSRIIPAGEYKMFRVVTGERFADKITEIVLASPLVVASESSNALFLKWDAEDQEVLFKPDGTSQTEHVADNIVVVTCPKTDTLYFVRTDKNRIYGTLAIPGLSYIAIDNLHKKLFALVPDKAKIMVVDLVGRTISDEINIPVTIDPTYIIMGPEARNAYILESQGNLIGIDVQTGNMLARNRISYQPVNIIYMADQGKLAVASAQDHKIYFVDPTDLRIIESISTDGEPHGLLELNGRLYITESDLDNVLTYDLGARIMLQGIPVADKPWRLASYGDNIYVSNRLDASVFLIKEGSSHIVSEISVGTFPGVMAIDEGRHFLYVASGGDCQGGLSIVDTMSNRLSGTIELGARPLDVKVVN